MPLINASRGVLFSIAIFLSAPVYIQPRSVALDVDQRDSWALEEEGETSPSKFMSGLATWYDASKNNAWYTAPNKWGDAFEMYGAAGPALRRAMGHKWMREPYAVRITSKKTGESAKVWITDYCGCQGREKDPDDTRLIDLAPAVWEKLGVDLSKGVMKVTLEILE